MKHTLMRLLLIGASISAASCSVSTDELAAAQAFHDEAEQCLYEVRDIDDMIFIASEPCMALYALNHDYFDAVQNPDNVSPEVELLFERGRLYGWMAVAISNQRGADLDGLWPHLPGHQEMHEKTISQMNEALEGLEELEDEIKENPDN